MIKNIQNYIVSKYYFQNLYRLYKKYGILNKSLLGKFCNKYFNINNNLINKMNNCLNQYKKYMLKDILSRFNFKYIKMYLKDKNSSMNLKIKPNYQNNIHNMCYYMYNLNKKYRITNIYYLHYP